MSRDLFEPLSSYQNHGWKDRWHKNHGNWLLAFSGLVCLAGFGFITFSKNTDASANQGTSLTPTVILPLDEDGSVIIPSAETTAVIRVDGIPAKDGGVRIAIYEDKESFNRPDLAWQTEIIAVNDSGVAILPLPVEGLPEKIAIAAYYDTNGDGELNRNLLGIPTEPYGFSNRARKMVGPPTFEDAAIAGPAPGTVVNLSIW